MPGIPDGSPLANSSVTLSGSDRAVADQVCDVAAALAGDSGAIDVLIPGLSLPDQALADLAGQSSTFVLTAASGAPLGLRTGHGRVLGVGTDRHAEPTATAAAVGLLRVSAADRAAAAKALDAAAGDIRSVEPVGPDALAWIVLALVRAGIVVRAEPVEPWPWSADGSPVALAPADVDRIRLTRANRADDGWYSVTVLRRLSKPLSGFAARHGWAPNAITMASLLIGLAAAGCFALGARWSLVIGAVLLQVSLVVDCSDGEVARLTGRFSALGAWLDAVTDRVKEFAAYAGLAVGAAAVSGVDLWWAAAATMILQTVRHLTDYTFDHVQRGWEAAGAVRPLLEGSSAGPIRAATPGGISGGPDGVADPAPPGAGGSIATMLRRTVFLPIGERWLIISLSAALLGPAWTFAILLTAGAVSFAYAQVGRIRRTLRQRGSRSAAAMIRSQIDSAPLSWLLSGPNGPDRVGRSGSRWSELTAVPVLALALVVVGLAFVGLGIGHWQVAGVAVLAAAVLIAVMDTEAIADSRFAWALPAVLAAIELGMWWVASAVLGASGPWVFGLLFCVAFHRYDLLYRAVAGVAPPVWLTVLCGGVPLRLLILAAAILAGTPRFGDAVPVVAIYFGVVMVVVASVQWVRQQASVPRPKGAIG